MEKFKLKGEYIQLNQLLKALFWVGTGGEAMIRISEGEVEVNGEITTVKRKKLHAGDTVAYNGNSVLLTAE